jgi:hypothetical protein
MKRILLLAATLTLAALTAGCATSQAEMTHQATMYDKQIAATEKAKPVPIFQMVGLPGQSIELKGVQSISVYSPSDATGKVPAFKAPQNEGLRIAEKLIDGTVNVILGRFGLSNSLADKGRGAASDDLLKHLDTSMTIENPFTTK